MKTLKKDNLCISQITPKLTNPDIHLTVLIDLHYFEMKISEYLIMIYHQLHISTNSTRYTKYIVHCTLLGMAVYSPNSAHLWKTTFASMKKDVRMFIIIILFYCEMYSNR